MKLPIFMIVLGIAVAATLLIVSGIVVAVILFATRSGARKSCRSSGSPVLPDSTSDSVPLFDALFGSDSGSSPSSMDSAHHHAPSDSSSHHHIHHDAGGSHHGGSDGCGSGGHH